jgi:hypothetical protein
MPLKERWQEQFKLQKLNIVREFWRLSSAFSHV